jgi:hypothetical protein
VRISHRDSLLTAVSVGRSAPVCAADRLSCPLRPDTCTGRENAPTSQNGTHTGPLLQLVCWIDELALLEGFETYVKTAHRLPANFMIWGTSRTPQLAITTHGRSEKRANRGNGL